jgi:hypothetical protein
MIFPKKINVVPVAKYPIAAFCVLMDHLYSLISFSFRVFSFVDAASIDKTLNTSYQVPSLCAHTFFELRTSIESHSNILV